MIASTAIAFVLSVAPMGGSAHTHQNASRITILYDAFGARADLTKDWGYSALVEYGGRRVLFDTGNNAEVFARNASRLRADLKRLDAVVISHRHGDHTSGLSYVLKVDPKVSVYAPQEAGFFEGLMPRGFLEPETSLPPEMRYFGGKPPERFATGNPWPTGNFQTVLSPKEILPGFFVFPTKSAKVGTTEMNELALAIRTPKGLAVVVGCSHPGVENILREAAKLADRLYSVAGGFHLVMTPRPEIERVGKELRDGLQIERVAPGHCTSELGFKVFWELFGDRFDPAGVGAVIGLP